MWFGYIWVIDLNLKDDLYMAVSENRVPPIIAI